MAAKILVVDDDANVQRLLQYTLKQEGYEVVIASDGAEGFRLWGAEAPDLILLDVMLPKMNGFEVCRSVRAQGLDVPIVMLTAKGQEEDVVLGLNLGADDYITKPFRVGELIARARALLRRRGADRTVQRFGDCEIDVSGRKVRRHGVPVDLTAREFALLAYFASRPGRALARDTILNDVWGASVFVTPRSIDRCVATLRAKVEPDPHNPAYIQTIREIGYRFEPGG